MSTPDDQNCNCRHLLADQETWEIILEPAFCNDPGAADALAHLLFMLKKAIASGPEGSIRVINTLQDGIRMVWPYTEEHKLARELYEIRRSPHAARFDLFWKVSPPHSDKRKRLAYLVFQNSIYLRFVLAG